MLTSFHKSFDFFFALENKKRIARIRQRYCIFIIHNPQPNIHDYCIIFIDKLTFRNIYINMAREREKFIAVNLKSSMSFF